VDLPFVHAHVELADVDRELVRAIDPDDLGALRRPYQARPSARGHACELGELGAFDEDGLEDLAFAHRSPFGRQATGAALGRDKARVLAEHAVGHHTRSSGRVRYG
jgi:hypothetical protein